MRPVLSAVFVAVVFVALGALGVGCGSNGMGTVDGGGDDDPTGDGGGGTANPRTVKLTLPNRPNNAAGFSFVVAYQDGGSAWTLAPAPTGDTYSFEINAPVYGVAFTCISNITGSTLVTQTRTVTTAHFAIGERTEVTLEVPARCSDRVGQQVTLSGTVFNRPIGGVVAVQWGGRQAFVNTAGQYALTAPTGTHDLVVVHAVPQGNGDFYVDETIVLRNVALTGPTTRSIDFSEALATQYFPVTIGQDNERAVAQTTLYTANGTSGVLVRQSTSWETEALADAQMLASDIYDQSITLSKAGSSATVTNATSTPGAQTWVAPPALGAVASQAISKMPYITLSTGWPAYANAAGYQWNAQQQLAGQQCGGNVPCTIVWSSFVSPGVVGMTPGYVMPDLKSLAGWKSAFELVGGQEVVGSVTALTSSAGAGDFPPPTPPANGTKRAFVRSDFSVTP